ncbi:hypothetical protein [Nannocystis punicea]|uniref:Uncharacterized protein n=1 Tax=Nannocystis punicea TaxID=2995304 RepID=A0ABY7HC01_9BACT|nr:hypothetical protein [Nannocystis poenicansa]WAS96610.1 hypothetical protein O0S08_10670 [Nannocystis poenicansa]
MSKPDRNLKGAWIVHGVALALWVALYWYLFGEALLPVEKSTIDSAIAGIGAVVAVEVLISFMVLSSLVMLFVGRRPLVPLFIHGLAVTVCWAGTVEVEQDKQARAEAHAREEARARAAERRERELEEQARLASEAEERRREELERQPEGCLHVRELRVQDGKKPRAEATFANTCDGEVVVDDLTVLGLDRAGGEDVLRRWDEDRVTVPRGGTATAAIEEVVKRDGDRSSPLARWVWQLNVDTAAPRSMILCFATAGAPDGALDGASCAPLEKVTIVP